MALAIGIPAVICSALIFALLWLLRRMSAASVCLPAQTDWIEELSVERYRPMMGLLDRSDLEFLRSQPGYTRARVRKLRLQRSRMFRGYLRALTLDFQRVCSAIAILMLQARHDRPDLAAALYRHQIVFGWTLLQVRVRLVFYDWGLCSADVKRLLSIFDCMRLELRRLVPAAAPMSA